MKKLLLFLLMLLWAQGAWANTTKTICASSCNFTTITLWLASLPATLLDEETGDVQGPITDSPTISGFTTTSSNYINIISSVNKGITATDANWTAKVTGAITVSANYTQISWLNMVGNIVSSNNFTPLTVHDCIIHDVNQTLISQGSNVALTVYNCILYNNTGASNFKDAVGGSGNNTVNVYNTVAYNLQYRAFDRNSGTTMNVVNSYAGSCNHEGSGGGCYDVVTTNSGYNMADDTTATTSCTLGGCVNSVTASSQFVSTTNNFQLLSTSALRAAGTAETGVFTNDINNATRPATWAIGAAEYVSSVVSSITNIYNAKVYNASIN